MICFYIPRTPIPCREEVLFFIICSQFTLIHGAALCFRGHVLAGATALAGSMTGIKDAMQA